MVYPQAGVPLDSEPGFLSRMDGVYRASVSLDFHERPGEATIVVVGCSTFRQSYTCGASIPHPVGPNKSEFSLGFDDVIAVKYSGLELQPGGRPACIRWPGHPAQIIWRLTSGML